MTINQLKRKEPVQAILFDDGRGKLSPLTDLRPAFDVRTGVLTTRERLGQAFDLVVVAVFVPARLEPLVRSQARGQHVNAWPEVVGEVLCVNGRSALAHPPIGDLRSGQYLIEQGSGDVVAARLSGAAARAFAEGGFVVPADVPEGDRVQIGAPALISRPWHVRTFRDAAMAVDLVVVADAIESAPQPAHSVRFGMHGLDVHKSAKVYPGVVFDCEGGPIVIDEGATVRPGVTLIGPCAVGKNATVGDRAVVRANTAIGPWCKVAGEIGGTIFQGYANKAHDGYLGDSWVGEWANLGAGTTNSNLLNTYGEVVCKCEPGGSNERSGQQFLGAIIGDHVKTAICTRIMTGAIVHTGAMWAAGRAISGCVAPFAWVTDEGEKRFRVEKFLDIARTVMGRRKVEMSVEYAAVVAEREKSR